MAQNGSGPRWTAPGVLLEACGHPWALACELPRPGASQHQVMPSFASCTAGCIRAPWCKRRWAQRQFANAWDSRMPQPLPAKPTAVRAKPPTPSSCSARTHLPQRALRSRPSAHATPRFRASRAARFRSAMSRFGASTICTRFLARRYCLRSAPALLQCSFTAQPDLASAQSGERATGCSDVSPSKQRGRADRVLAPPWQRDHSRCFARQLGPSSARGGCATGSDKTC